MTLCPTHAASRSPHLVLCRYTQSGSLPSPGATAGSRHNTSSTIPYCPHPISDLDPEAPFSTVARPTASPGFFLPWGLCTCEHSLSGMFSFMRSTWYAPNGDPSCFPPPSLFHFLLYHFLSLSHLLPPFANRRQIHSRINHRFCVPCHLLPSVRNRA